MPFYDDFDLSTVDVLLISQYVSTLALRASIEVGGPGASLQSYLHGGLYWANILYIRNNGISFAPSSPTPLMCLQNPGPPLHSSVISSVQCSLNQQTDLTPFHS